MFCRIQMRAGFLLLFFPLLSRWRSPGIPCYLHNVEKYFLNTDKCFLGEWYTFNGLRASKNRSEGEPCNEIIVELFYKRCWHVGFFFFKFSNILFREKWTKLEVRFRWEGDWVSAPPLQLWLITRSGVVFESDFDESSVHRKYSRIASNQLPTITVWQVGHQHRRACTSRNYVILQTPRLVLQFDLKNMMAVSESEGGVLFIIYRKNFIAAQPHYFAFLKR